MNKYSSKAIKTAATVGMSLAMVLSNVAPALAATTTNVCDVKTTYTAGQQIGSTKEFAGTYDITKVRTDAAEEINAAYNSSKTTIYYKGADRTVKFGYLIGNSMHESTGATTAAELGTNGLGVPNKATYGYYTETEFTYQEIVDGVLSTLKVAANTFLEVNGTIYGSERTSATVKNEVDKYVRDNTKAIAITDVNGNPSTVELVASYQVGSADETLEAPDTYTTDGVKVTIKVKEDAKDYSCKEVTAPTDLNITDRSTAKNVYNEIVAAFEKKSLTFETVKPGDKVDFTKTNTAALGENKIIINDDRKLDLDMKAVFKQLARYLDNTTDEGKAVERLVDMDTAMEDMFNATTGILAKAEKYDEDTKFETTSAYAAAAELLEDFNDFDTYLTNLNDADYDRVTEAKSVLEDLVSNYVAENDGDLLDTYLTNLDKFYEAFVDKNGAAGITKAQVDAAIKQIKNGTTFTDVKGKEVTIEKSDYTTFKENSGVEEYMTKFEDMYDEIQAVKDAVAKSNEAYKDLIKGDTSVKDFLTNKDSDRKLTSGKEFSSIKSNLTVDEYKILKAYKEEVLDAVLTLETKQVGNSYVNKSEKSIYATTAQLNSVLNNIGNGTDLDKGVFTKLDKEKGEFNWDKLVAHMEKVEASLEAVTTAIEKLDSISLTVNDRAAIIAADDAVYFLTGDGADNLTSAQTRTVKNADRKVTELMEAYRMKFGSINAGVNGWVNKGNGDWTYYENGNAVTKWVASGSDWYYVKGGVMLRNSWIASDSQGTKWYYVDDAGKMVSNTTVNGYTFNSYGVWVK